jgi:copper transport protein
MKASFLAIVGSMVLLPVCALAHAHLVRSSPAENAILDMAPPAATLVFAEPVTLTAVNIESAAGARTSVKPLPANPTAEVSVALPTLATGRYKLSWRAVSDDGHVMSGVIHFTVGKKGGQ